MDDPYVSCPYNADHRVPQSRIQKHLLKCPDLKPDWVFCPYNHSHRMPQNDLAAHIKECKLGSQVSDLFYHNVLKHPVHRKKNPVQQISPDEEIWD